MVVMKALREMNKDINSRLSWLFIGHIYILYSGIIAIDVIPFSMKLTFIGISGMVSIAIIRDWVNKEKV